MADYRNLASFFKQITGDYSSRNAIFWRNPSNPKGGMQTYESLNGNKLKELVYLAARSIESFGLERGDTAAIISETRFEWVVADFACILNGLVTVPVYINMTTEQIKYILEHSGAKICFVSSALLAEKVSAVFSELPDLEKIISFNKSEIKLEHVVDFEDLIYIELVHDKKPYDENTANAFIDSSSGRADENDLLTIIYTSGTTGNPKGVCLTHKNVLSNVKQCTDSFEITDKDRFLSFLPLAHTYERTAGYYLPLSKCAEIYYAQSIETLNQQMQEVKPTILLTVPILFSRIQSRLLKSIEQMPKLKKLITKKALAAGLKYRENKNSLFWKLADKRVFKHIRQRTGGKIRFFISGGSALNKELAEFFDSIGIMILQGYGMTESSPVISVCREEHKTFGTVGPPLVGVTVKIAEDGEILVKGDNVMQGYFKNDKDTSETIINGWLHTGDIGEIDKQGVLKITDRKKTLIKTSGGKYISLTHVEDTLLSSMYIEQIITFASDERQYVSALIVPDFDELTKYAAHQKITFPDNKSLVNDDRIHSFIQKEVNEAQKHLAKYERVRKFALMPSAFTIEGGEMTPTLKLKRKIIEEKYKSLIDSFYEVRKRSSN